MKQLLNGFNRTLYVPNVNTTGQKMKKWAQLCNFCTDFYETHKFPSPLREDRLNRISPKMAKKHTNYRHIIIHAHKCSETDTVEFHEKHMEGLDADATSR